MIVMEVMQIEYVYGQVMKNDLDGLGYVMEYCKIDTQNYLLPQRRNRVYATADVGNGQNASEYEKNMQKTMEAMSSGVRIPTDEILNHDLPEEHLTSERQMGLLQKSIEHASDRFASNNLFIDGSTSSSRIPEYSHASLTCIRPSHGIYSVKYKRWVTVQEMWNAQGLWLSNFENPQAVENMLATNPKDAQDLCGNAFSGTAVQAKVLASMVHSMGWESIAHEKKQNYDGVLVVSEMDTVHHSASSDSCDANSGFQTPIGSKSSSLKRSLSTMSAPRSSTSSGTKDSCLRPTLNPGTPAEKIEHDVDPEATNAKRRRYRGKNKA